MPENQLDKEIGGRLITIVDAFYSGSARKLALTFDIDSSYFSKVTRGERGITVEKAVDISSAHNIDLNWLFTGRGEMILKEKSGTLKAPDVDFTTLRKQLDSALSNLQEAMKTLPQPLGPEIPDSGNPAFRQGRKKKTEMQ